MNKQTTQNICLAISLNFIALVMVWVASVMPTEPVSDAEKNKALYAAEFMASIKAQNDALDAKGCTAEPMLTDSVWVVNTDKDRHGHPQHDKGIVQEVTFDVALDKASHGEVVVQRYC